MSGSAALQKNVHDAIATTSQVGLSVKKTAA